MNAKKFAWLYLVKNGVAGRTPSYYGGYEYDVELENDPRFAECFSEDRYGRVCFELIDEIMHRSIQNIGVNWESTKSPRSDYVSEFQGTFCDPGRREVITGTLVLNDGSEQNWIADAIEVTNVFDMMARVHEATADFEKYFGAK